MRIIDIPNERLIGSPHCYNNSIIDVDKELFMFYRYYVGGYGTDIAVCQLDESFNVVPKSNKRLSLIRTVGQNFTMDDPRAFHVGKNVFLMHCQGHLLNSGKDWIWTGALVFNKIYTLKTNPPQMGDNVLPNFGRNINQASKRGALPLIEKNWTPFSGLDSLRFLYMINPLVVVDYDSKEKTAKEISRSEFNQDFWKWGDFLAGSTPLIRYKDGWLGFFHSHLHDSENNRRQYYVGVYTLSADTPYRVTRMSKEPFMTAEMDIEKDLRSIHQGWFPNCIFPCGLIKRNDKFYMSYGWQDCRCKIVEIEEYEIEANLMEIPT